MAKVKKAKKAGKKTKRAGTKKPAKKKAKKKSPPKSKVKSESKARGGDAFALDEGVVVLFDAVCDTVNCATPELARAVTSFVARQATNAHATTNPTHAPRVVPEA
jgi:hypothetical protein